MPKCFKCGADTILFENGVAICVKCSDEEKKKKTLDSAQTAMAHAHSRLNNYLSRGIVPEDLKQAI